VDLVLFKTKRVNPIDSTLFYREMVFWACIACCDAQVNLNAEKCIWVQSLPHPCDGIEWDSF